MHVIVTGAGGFVGQALVQRLLQADARAATPQPLTRLTAIDQRFAADAPAWHRDPRALRLEGDFADPALLARALAVPPDWVFHLASVPGSLAEREQALGWQVNGLATLALLQRLAGVAGTPPRVVFASSVAVYGALPVDGAVDESRPTQPALSYGAHKRMAELLLADLSRQRRLDGVSLRLPGIVARPLPLATSTSGHGSAFMSDLIRVLGAGAAYECPVSASARAWWMSLPCCVGNLLHAAGLPAAQLPASATVQLPVITATVAEVVAAISASSGKPARVSYRPDARTEALFGRQPVLDTPQARALGFTDDGSLARLVQRATAAA